MVGGEADKGGERPRERGTETGGRDPEGKQAGGRQILTGGAQTLGKWQRLRSQERMRKREERENGGGQKPTEE